MFALLLARVALAQEPASRPIVYDPPLDGPLQDVPWPHPDPYGDREVCPATADSIRAEADYAIDRLRRGDEAAFKEHAAKVARSLTCLTEVVTPRTAEHVHMVQGLRTWAEGDPGKAAKAWWGLMATRADYQPPPDLIPEGSRQSALIESARTLGDGRQQRINSGYVFVDGLTDREGVPWERAALVQRMEDPDPSTVRIGFDGLRRVKKVVLTWYLWGTGGITDEILGPVVDDPRRDTPPAEP